MNNKIHDQKNREMFKTDFRQVVYANFELLAEDIVDILIMLEQKYKNRKLLLNDKFSDELGLKFDNILSKRLKSIITDFES